MTEVSPVLRFVSYSTRHRHYRPVDDEPFSPWPSEQGIQMRASWTQAMLVS